MWGTLGHLITLVPHKTQAPRPLCGFVHGSRASRTESSTVVHAHVTAAGHFLDGKVKIELNHRRCTKLLGNHVGKQYVTGFQMMCFLDVFGIYMGVSLNLWYPHFTPQVLIICRSLPPWVCWGFTHQPLGHLLEVSSCFPKFPSTKNP